MDETVEYDMGDLLLHISELYSDYTDCAIQHDKLIKVIKEPSKNN